MDFKISGNGVLNLFPSSIINNRGLVSVVVFIDLHKAFDTIDVNIHFSKLSMLGISGVELRWFQSYLTDRSQSVMFDGPMTDPLHINISVPQGSILGPLLFLLYLNGLPTVAQDCSVNMYADDTEIENMCKADVHIQLEISFNDDLCSLKKYCDVNRLNINVAKCVFILIDIHQALQKMLDI